MLLREETLRSTDYGSLTDLLRAFLGQSPPRIDRACFGIAGPVQAARSATPNLPWIVDAGEIKAALCFHRVTLINDLLATARGISDLPPESFAVLQEGRADPEGNAAVIAAGTGLGEALLFRHGSGLLPSPSEGGHAGFAPTSDLEVDLLRFLAAEFGHVSAERVISGPGLQNVYRFLTATGREPESLRVRDRMRIEDAAAVISDEGMRGTDAACGRALDLWVRAYGAEAGNLALKALATAGLYIGGGIAPKILPKLREGRFISALRDKGRLSGVLAEIPVRVILNEKTALHGAAACAAEAEGRP